MQWKNKNIPDARTAVEWMLTHILSCSRVDLYLNFDQPLKGKELETFKSFE